MAEYIRDAVMSYVMTHEEDYRVERERIQTMEEKKRPRGLGINHSFRKRATEMTPNEASLTKQYQPPPPQTTVVVQQAPAPAASPGMDIKMLAAYVAEIADPIERESRERAVEGILRAAVKTPEELERLAKALDDEVAVHDAKRGDRPGSLSRPASPWGWLSGL